MRASIGHVVGVLKATRPPTKIWQEPFDYDPSHYKRLCHLKGAEPDPGDLWDYAQDLNYVEKIQEDLFRYLLPICLQGWRAYLFTGGSKYGGFVEWFSPALVHRPLLNELLTKRQYKAVMVFMRDTLLDRMDEENELKFSGMGASPYTWFYALGSFAVIFPSLRELWESWWNMETKGHAICALQYISCLMYRDDSNPIFAAWTSGMGGGPPALWETDGNIYDHGWNPENIRFIAMTLTPDYLHDKLHQAKSVLVDKVDSTVLNLMLADFESHKQILNSRLAQLPKMLFAPGVQNWCE